jgi:hypothetical protein
MNVRRRVLLSALVAVTIVVGFALRAWWLDQRAGRYARVATQLKQSLSSEARFGGVTVRRTRHNVEVLAPDTLQVSTELRCRALLPSAANRSI